MGMKSPEQIKASMETRLRGLADPSRGRDIHRLRTLLVMERFLARVAHVLPDTAYGDALHGEPEVVEGSDFFEKYGIPPVRIPIYPTATHLAEKVHAYTLPRGDRVNMRLKDLVDIPLIASLLDGRDASDLRVALGLTFEFRDSHPLPSCLPTPPVEWLGPYDRLVREEAMLWPTLADLHRAASRFLDPVLAGGEGRWSNADGRWITL